MHCHLVSRSERVELFPHSPIRPHGVVRFYIYLPVVSAELFGIHNFVSFAVRRCCSFNLQIRQPYKMASCCDVTLNVLGSSCLASFKARASPSQPQNLFHYFIRTFNYSQFLTGIYPNFGPICCFVGWNLQNCLGLSVFILKRFMFLNTISSPLKQYSQSLIILCFYICNIIAVIIRNFSEFSDFIFQIIFFLFLHDII
jgi:hypothetical protein